MCGHKKRAGLDEITVSAHEIRADRALYAADPELAIALGYQPLPPRDRQMIERGTQLWSELQLMRSATMRAALEQRLHSSSYSSFISRL